MDTARLEACLRDTPSVQCVGMAAEACLAQTGPGNLGVCLGAEHAWWVARRQSAEAILSAMEPGIALRAERTGVPVPSLDAISLGFEAYRDAACGWRVAQWEGMHTGPEEMDCVLQLTAQHVLWLETRVTGD